LIKSPESTNSTPGTTLPPELRLKILDCLAPMLSTVQRSRVYQFARDRNTLPSALLQLPGVRPLFRSNTDPSCIPDPTASGSASSLFMRPALPSQPPQTSTAVWTIKSTSDVSNPVSRHNCANGCIGGLRCRREESRTQWLDMVECQWYDPDGSNSVDDLQIMSM
jgi:hypothetical protein